MNSEDKTLISDRIDKEIKETQEKVEKYRKLSKPISPENAIGRISRMDAINNKSVVEAALRESEHKLDNLIFVKSQLESKEFGLCIKCKQSIPIGRILFRPQSKKCVNCAN
jgi:DnaK suppressor protein